MILSGWWEDVLDAVVEQGGSTQLPVDILTVHDDIVMALLKHLGCEISVEDGWVEISFPGTGRVCVLPKHSDELPFPPILGHLHDTIAERRVFDAGGNVDLDRYRATRN